jgi:DHA1 family tetracycline resistance protein-like MFS transporter
MNRALIVILLAVTLDSIGIGLVFPILPSLLRDVSHSGEVATIYGAMLALYALMQFVFSPVLGMLSDRFGRLPESHKGTRKPVTLAGLNPFTSINWAIGVQALLPFLAIYLVFNFIGQVYGTIWVLFGEDRFGWSTFWVGMSLAGFGICMALVQAFLPGPITKRVGERGALYLGMAFEGTACLLTAFATEGWMLFVLMPLFALGGVGMPALQSMVTRQVAGDSQGRLQGVLASVASISAIIGPLVYSGIYFWSRDVWIGTVWVFCALIFLFCVPIVRSIRDASPQPA